MKKKNKIAALYIVVSILVLSTIGVSFAYFASIINTDGNKEVAEITTEELGSIKWTGKKVYTSSNILPGECGVQTFTIEKNSESGKGIYEVDLNGVIDEAFGEDIEISLYKSADDNSNVTIDEGESTIEGTDNLKYYKEDSIKINGEPELIYGPTALENKNPIILEQADFNNKTLKPTTYYLVYCYKNIGNQDHQQVKNFSGEINVKLILDKSMPVASEMNITYTSNNAGYDTTEQITFNATSSYYAITKYSLDGETYKNIATPSKNVSVTESFASEEPITIYFKDLVGNIKSKNITLQKIDKTGPDITASAQDDWSTSKKITINLSDNKSGLAGYQVTEEKTEPTDWLSASGSTVKVEYEARDNKTYYIYAKDKLGNISLKEMNITHIDNKAPTIKSLKEQEAYGQTNVITATVLDDESGITGYAFTETEEEPTTWTSVSNVITEIEYTHTLSENKTIYFWVKDALEHVSSQKIVTTKIDIVAPTITIKDGDYDSSSWARTKYANVTFKDDYSGIDSYNVTTSEKEPSAWDTIKESPTAYDEKINFQHNGTYYIWVKDKSGLVSHTSIYVKKIDSSGPTLKVSTTSTGSSITIKALANDTESGIDEYQYTIESDTSAPQEYTSPTSTYTFTGLSVGCYSIRVTVTDNVGNSNSNYVTAYVDSEKPSASAYVSNTYDMMAEISVSASDNYKIKSATLKDSNNRVVQSWNNVESINEIVTVSSGGDYTFTVIDFNNNTESYTLFVPLEPSPGPSPGNPDPPIDTTNPPTVNMSCPTGGDYVQNAEITWTVSSSNSITSCELSTPDSTESLTDCSYGSYIATKNGTYTLTVTDMYGNTGSDSVNITNIDDNAPTITSIDVTQLDESSISVNVIAEDYNTDYSMGSGVIQYHYTLYDPSGSIISDETSTSSTHTFSGLSKGTYRISVMVYDKIGMPSENTKSITLV